MLTITLLNVVTVLFYNGLMWMVYTKRINLEHYRTYPVLLPTRRASGGTGKPTLRGGEFSSESPSNWCSSTPL